MNELEAVVDKLEGWKALVAANIEKYGPCQEACESCGGGEDGEVLDHAGWCFECRTFGDREA